MVEKKIKEAFDNLKLGKEVDLENLLRKDPWILKLINRMKKINL